MQTRHAQPHAQRVLRRYTKTDARALPKTKERNKRARSRSKRGMSANEECRYPLRRSYRLPQVFDSLILPSFPS